MASTRLTQTLNKPINMADKKVPVDQIQTRILVLRGQRVLLDSDLARFYGVPTSRFNEAVNRNAERFPGDFRFQLIPEELNTLISQIAISKTGRGGVRKMPWAFNEHGALMAATVFNSRRAVQMSLVVIRAFVALRRLVLDQKALSEKLAELDARVGGHDEQIEAIIETIRQLTAPLGPEHDRKIGFHPGSSNSGVESVGAAAHVARDGISSRDLAATDNEPRPSTSQNQRR